jgi:hypothetical protein
MQSKATTVAAYLASLPADRRADVESVRAVILKNLDTNYQEGMQYGMIGYYIPHSIYPAGYHCDPKQALPFAGLAAQKNNISLYLMCVYGNSEHTEWFQKAWAKTGKKLDMGKACVRFKKAEDAALDVIGEAVRRVPAKKYIEQIEKVLAKMATRPRKGPPKKSTKPAAKSAKKKSARRTKSKT